MVLPVGGGEHRLFHAAEEALAQRLVGLECGQQLLATVIAGRMGHQLIAIVHHRAFELFAIKPQAAHQCVDRHQHRPRDIIGIDLVARHQQHGRALGRTVQRVTQQFVDTQQTICRGVVRLAAGTMQHAIEPRLDDEARPRRAVVEQVRRPAGDALLHCTIVDAQVVLDQAIGGQRCVRHQMNQVYHGVSADGQALAAQLAERHALLQADRRAFQNQRQLERPRANQPERQKARLSTPQQRARQHGG